MSRRASASSVGLIVLAATAIVISGGCPESVFQNLTKERTGNISMQFINNTDYLAAFSYGSWDEWDHSPGDATLEQLLLSPNSVSTAATVPCRRNAAVGTQRFVNRVLATQADDTDDFIPEAFDVTVHFSSAPTGSDAEQLPTAGTAAGVEVWLGVDYSCGDQLVFTFWEDPDAPGGFRVDYEVILDEE